MQSRSLSLQGQLKTCLISHVARPAMTLDLRQSLGMTFRRGRMSHFTLSPSLSLSRQLSACMVVMVSKQDIAHLTEFGFTHVTLGMSEHALKTCFRAF